LPPRSAAASTLPENQNAETLQHLELLYDTLHLLEAEIETPEPRAKDKAPGMNSESPLAACSRLLMDRQRFAAVAKAEHFAAKSLGAAYWGAPGWHDKVYEIIWHNPLDYASEKKPYALGRFLIFEKLSEQCTYGTYRTRDHSLERPVILKALHPAIQVQQRHNESQRAEMVNRIRRLGRLEHPGIAVIYDLGAHEDIFYYVREHIEGENLAQTLAGKKTLPPAEAVRLLVEVCRILRYAHQNGVYHGNLKPSNIWQLRMAVTKDLSPARALLAPPASQFDKMPINIKISDFFIPGFNEISTASGHYAPPELLFQKQSDQVKAFQAMVDVYALGMILYDCVCQENPFKQIEFPAARNLWEQVQLAPLAMTNINAPDRGMLPVLDEIIHRATHQDPLQRFQTLDALETALRQTLKQPLALIHKPMNWVSKAK
jgi:serine/threonine protein kinase